MRLPEQALGGDLIWWRQSPAAHTAVTVWGGIEDLYLLGSNPPPESEVLFRLHDTSGKLHASWIQTMRPGVPLTIDSRDRPEIIPEGVLAIFPTANLEAAGESPLKYRRFFSMVDWYSEAGELVSLHSDHSVAPFAKPIEFTEVVFVETPDLRNYLVLVNGVACQSEASVTLQVRNHLNETRFAVYSPAMAPFSVHRLCLNELFPGLVEFCQGRHATLEGTFDCRNLFSRPYVMTEGEHLAGYHGGDRYQFTGIPRFLYKALGRGEVNPMAAIHSETLTTTVNLLNSHGDLEEDFWIDARLYDEAGTQVAYRERWLLARRHGLSRGDIADLLGEDHHFAGHIALSFTPDAKPFYPRRLQALMEYRSPVSVARVMAWSDIWNGRERVRQLRDEFAGFFPIENFYGEKYLGGSGVFYRCHYRMWYRPPIRSSIAITNCGIAEDYSETVAYSVRLFNARGESLLFHGTLGPHATAFGPVDRFFPSAEDFLSPAGIGVASVESRADLAVMHFSHHETSGVYSAEHFMASVNYYGGKTYTCCGA